MEEKEITVEFKESYMPHSVKRTCVNMTKEQIIKQYDLNNFRQFDLTSLLFFENYNKIQVYLKFNNC